MCNAHATPPLPPSLFLSLSLTTLLHTHTVNGNAWRVKDMYPVGLVPIGPISRFGDEVPGLQSLDEFVGQFLKSHNFCGECHEILISCSEHTEYEATCSRC
jgi:hypothetical protein